MSETKVIRGIDCTQWVIIEGGLRMIVACTFRFTRQVKNITYKISCTVHYVPEAETVVCQIYCYSKIVRHNESFYSMNVTPVKEQKLRSAINDGVRESLGIEFTNKIYVSSVNPEVGAYEFTEWSRQAVNSVNTVVKRIKDELYVV